MKISKEFESFFLHNQITLCASMVEARKGGMMYLANREAARSGMWRQDQQKGFGRSALVLGASLVLLCFSLVRCPVVSAKLGKYKWTTTAAVAVEKEYLVVEKTCTERGSSGKLLGTGRSTVSQRALGSQLWLLRYSCGNGSLWGDGKRGGLQWRSLLCGGSTRSGLSVLEEAFCRADTKFYSRRSSILWCLSLCGRGLWIVSYVIWCMLHAENHQHQWSCTFVILVLILYFVLWSF